MIKDTPFIPVFHGDKSRSGYRLLAEKTGDGLSFRTAIQNNADGSSTMLRTKGGMPEVTTTRVTLQAAMEDRGLCVALSTSETHAKVVYCAESNGPFLAHKNPPHIETAVSYTVSAVVPEKFAQPPVPGKDYFDVLYVGEGKLWKSTKLLRSLPTVSGIPVLVEAVTEPYLFFISEQSVTPVTWTGVDVGEKLGPSGYIDGALESAFTFAGNVSATLPLVSFYGDFSYYARRSGYTYDVSLSATPPQLTRTGGAEYRKHWPSTYECNPTADPLITHSTPAMTTPSGVPGNAMAFVWSNRFETFEELYDGPEKTYYDANGDPTVAWWADNVVVMPPISAPVAPSSGSAYLSRYSGAKNGSDDFGAPSIGGVAHPIHMAWDTQFVYELRTQSGYWSAVSQGSIPYCKGRHPWYGAAQQFPWGDPTVNRGPRVANGSSYEIDGKSALSLTATAGNLPLVSISGACTVWRDSFTGYISRGAPGHVEEFAARIVSGFPVSHATVYKLTDELPPGSPTDGPLREWFYVSVLGVDGKGTDRTVWEYVDDASKIVRTRTIEVSARDYLFHDTHNDVSIWLEFQGSGSLDQGSGSLTLHVSAKGRQFSEVLSAQSGDNGVRLGVETMVVGNYYPGAEWLPVPEIPCTFAPPCEQGLVDYLCYTTAEEEALGVIPQFLISLRLWIRDPWIGNLEEPTPPFGALAVMPNNTYATARCVGGGPETFSDAMYRLSHFRFSNEGTVNFDERLWPETTGVDKKITCWRI